MFQEAQCDKGTMLIHFEPRSAELRPDSPKCQRDKRVLE